MTQRIAFLGTGLMGTPMIRRLLAAGLIVHAWNRSAAKLDSLAVEGVVVANSPEQAVRDADLVFLCLTNADAVEDVLFNGPGAASTALSSGTLVVDFSTIGPARTRTIARRLAIECKASWVDAPVSGGVKGAIEGQLIILCGGAVKDVERIRGTLNRLAKRVSHVGPLGSGQAAKLCNQLIVATNVVAIAEALALARANDLDPRELPDALAGGWADSLPLQIIGKRMAHGTATPPIVSIGTFAKDLDLVRENACHLLELTAAARAVYARAAGIAAEDVTLLQGVIDQETSQ